MRDRRNRTWLILAALVAMFYMIGSVALAPAAQECTDGVDNDGDGLIDFASPATQTSDPGCRSADDGNETAAAGPACDNGEDDDGDGAVDVAGADDDPATDGDTGCESATDDSEDGEHPTEVSCFTIADEGDGTSESNDGDTIEDLLTKVDPDDADPATNETTIGLTGTLSTESLAIDPDSGDLYGVNGGQLGTFNVDTGAFTPTAEPVGTGSGSEGEVVFDNIDGLTFDPENGTLYASQREDGPDLLLQIDPETGAHVNDAFGAGADYVIIAPVEGLTDINDLAFADDGTLFAIANEDDEGDHLIEVDPATGSTADVGETGVDDVEGLGFAPDGRLLGTVSEPAGGIVDIDPATGTASNTRTLDNGADYEAIACQSEAAPPFNVTGTKFHDAEPLGTLGAEDGRIPDVEIHIFNEDGSVHEHTTTGTDGTYGFNVDPGIYTVCETVPDGFTQTFPTEGADCTAHEPVDHIGPWGHHVEVAAGEVSEHNDFGNAGGGCEGDSTISGTKWDDLNGDGVRDDGEPGVAGVTIRAARTDPAPPPEVTCETHTTEDGTYSLTVPAGTYTVCEVLPSRRIQTFPTEGPVCDEVTGPGTFGHEVTVAAGEESSGNDFGNRLVDDGCTPENDFPVPPCDIAGTKWNDDTEDPEGTPGEIDPTDDPAAGVPIHLFNADDGSEVASVSTNENGRYGFDELEPGTYIVCEDPPEGLGQIHPSEGADCTQFGEQFGPFGYEVTVEEGAEGSDGNDFLNGVLLHCSGPPVGHTPGLLLPDTIGQSLWDGGLAIPPLTEDPEHDGPLSSPLADLEQGLLGTEEVGCLVDLLIDGTVGFDL